jgi:uncharacterized membrane protein
MYHALVLLHVLCAIVAIGYNASYAVWLARGSVQRENLVFALRGIKFMDDRVANPCYIVLVLSGIGLVILSGRSWHQLWIEAALGLVVVFAVIGIAGYTPALARQIRVLEVAGPDAPEYKAANARQTALGIVTTVIAITIVSLMVFRPGGA